MNRARIALVGAAVMMAAMTGAVGSAASAAVMGTDTTGFAKWQRNYERQRAADYMGQFDAALPLHTRTTHLASILAERDKGGDQFKDGDYADAATSLAEALEDLGVSPQAPSVDDDD